MEQSLPKKREYILYAPLTQSQKDLYQSILDHNLRHFLENKHLSRATTTSGSVTPQSVTPQKRYSESPDPDEFSIPSTDVSGTSTPLSTGSRRLRKKARTSYKEMSDSEWYTAMEKAEREQFKDHYVPSPEVKKLTSSESTRIASPSLLSTFGLLGCEI